MVRGFYQLGSGILNQSKKLNTISNNIANSETAGYKKQNAIETAFGEMLLRRVDGSSAELGSTYMTTALDENAVIHTQGAVNHTGRALDFAIDGEGFFAVQKNDVTYYTRNGSFTLDNAGYLCSSDGARVLDRTGNDIYLGSAEFTCDERGNIYTAAGNASIGIYNFENYGQLSPDGNCLFTGDGAFLTDKARVINSSLEASNVDMATEMLNAISTQRSFQTASEALRMYDEVLSSACTQLGKI